MQVFSDSTTKKHNMVNSGDKYHNLFSVKPAKHTHQNNTHKINITDNWKFEKHSAHHYQKRHLS